MLGTYPVNSYLCRIKKMPSPICTHCNSGDVETLAHFLKYALNVIMLGQQHIIEYAKAYLGYCRDTLSRRRLQLRPVTTALVQQAGRAIKDTEIRAG